MGASRSGMTMAPTQFTDEQLRQALAAAVPTAERWWRSSHEAPPGRAAALLARVAADPAGTAFLLGFVDGVIRPEDPRTAAHALHRLGRTVPESLPIGLRALVRAGGVLAPLLPVPVVPLARRVLRTLVGDLVLDAGEVRLGPALARLARAGVGLNVNLLGEAVLGDGEAARRLEAVHRLVLRPDVHYVSLKVSAVLGPHNPWGFDEAVDRAVGLLEPLYRAAANQPTPVFVNLDMEEYHDLHLTLAVFRRVLDLPGLEGVAAGVVLQAYLPDALPQLQALQAWAAARVGSGGAPIRVRLVKGANLAMENVEAVLHGWPSATAATKEATDANYLRLLDWVLTPERTEAVRIGVAGHNLFTLAAAWELAGLRGVRDRVEVEMLAGMAPAQARVVREEVGGLRLYVPVVQPREFDVAIAYLVRRLEENSATENYLSSLFTLDPEAGLARERDRYLAAVQQLREESADPESEAVGPRRTQDRTLPRPRRARPDGEPGPGGLPPFINCPDTDTALPANLAWGREILQRVPTSRLGTDTVEAARITDPDEIDQVLTATAAAGVAWRRRPRVERAAIVHRIGDELEAARADLLEVAAAECGKTLDQSDPEVSEAVDFAHYYAEQTLTLGDLVGARFRPVRVTVVTPPWNFPLSIPLGGVAAALAAGSAVVLKPATAARRCGALLAEACWRAGVSRDVLRLVVPDTPEIGRRLVTDPHVGRLVLTGSAETAAMFRRWRPDLGLLAETSGKNAIVVTPSADIALAVRDIVASAFGHAGQKCSAASLLILVGAIGRSTRFRDQLIDATRSLTVGWPTDPSTRMGPLAGPPGDKLLRGLTTLGPGERWVLPPRCLDAGGSEAQGRLWTPGIRAGVLAGSEFHLVEYFGPVLGVMTVPDLAEAVRVQNGTDYGLTAGLHSLDPDEVAYWLAHVRAGNAYVNRSITGAIVRRQPFGGWKRSSVGTGNKAGGPHYLLGFGDVLPAPVDRLVPEPTAPMLRRVLQIGRTVLSAEEAVRLEVAVGLDQQALDEEFGRGHDPSALGVERNVLRYRPAPVLIRLGEGRPVAELVRELSAALALHPLDDSQARARPGMGHRVSSAVPLPDELDTFLRERGIPVLLESDADLLHRARHVGHRRDGRVRLLGGDPAALARALGGSIDIAVYAAPVVESGRVAILPYVQEQSVSITGHRYGHPGGLSDELGL